jgi:hypothetical protein
MSAVERAAWLADTIGTELGEGWRELAVELATDSGREAFANGNPVETAARKLYLDH